MNNETIEEVDFLEEIDIGPEPEPNEKFDFSKYTELNFKAKLTLIKRCLDAHEVVIGATYVPSLRLQTKEEITEFKRDRNVLRLAYQVGWNDIAVYRNGKVSYHIIEEFIDYYVPFRETGVLDACFISIVSNNVIFDHTLYETQYPLDQELLKFLIETLLWATVHNGKLEFSELNFIVDKPHKLLHLFGINPEDHPSIII